MVQAVVTLTDYADRVLNIVKAKNGFKRKDEALNLVVEEYGEEMLEPEFKPEFVNTVLKASKGKSKRISSLDELLK